MIKSANILKFNNGKVIIYPNKRVKDMGSYASEPFIIKQDLTYEEIAEELIKALKYSRDSDIAPYDWKEHKKKYLKSIGMKTMTMLHSGSLDLNVFTKEESYNICPSINKGSRQGFQGTKDRVIIPISSSIEELAEALREAFEKSS